MHIKKLRSITAACVIAMSIASAAVADVPPAAPGSDLNHLTIPTARSLTMSASLALARPRTSTDQPDDEAGSQVHLVYVVPSDGVDHALDTNGTIDGSIASAETWLASQTNGRTLRLDSFGGTPDISFLRLTQTNAAVAAQGAFVRELVEGALTTAGFNDPNKMYLAWYDGLSTFSCGAAPFRPRYPATPLSSISKARSRAHRRARPIPSR